MKVTLRTTMAGPDGIAHPGMTIEVTKEVADDMIKRRLARPYDRHQDKNARHGLIPAAAPDRTSSREDE